MTTSGATPTSAWRWCASSLNKAPTLRRCAGRCPPRGRIWQNPKSTPWGRPGGETRLTPVAAAPPPPLQGALPAARLSRFRGSPGAGTLRHCSVSRAFGRVFHALGQQSSAPSLHRHAVWVQICSNFSTCARPSGLVISTRTEPAVASCSDGGLKTHAPLSRVAINR